MIWWFEEIVFVMVMLVNVFLWMDLMKKWKEWFMDIVCVGIILRV